MTTLGYYTAEGLHPVCLDDADADDVANGTPILSGDEVDTPTHCEVCEDLIPHALTGEGYEYVFDRLADYVDSKGARGRGEILDQWRRYVEDGHGYAGHRDQVVLALYDALRAVLTGATFATFDQHSKFTSAIQVVLELEDEA